MSKTTSYFNDIEDTPLEPSDDMKGLSYLDKVLALQIGNGSNVLRSDESGLWLGAAKWADAPYRVDMDGKVSSGIDPHIVIMYGNHAVYRLWAGAEDPTAARFSVDLDGNVLIQSASGQLVLDALNNRILVTDGTNNRIVIGSV